MERNNKMFIVLVIVGCVVAAVMSFNQEKAKLQSARIIKMAEDMPSKK